MSRGGISATCSFVMATPVLSSHCLVLATLYEYFTLLARFFLSVEWILIEISSHILRRVFKGDASDKMCGGWRWSSGKDLHAHVIFQQYFSSRLCSNSF